MKAYYFHSQIHEIPFVNHFAGVLGMPRNTLHAEGILCAFFKTFRERIPLFASRALIAHLPTDVHPLYKRDWNQEFATTFDYYEFVEALFTTKNKNNSHFFNTKGKVEAVVSAFFEVIKKEATEEKTDDLILSICFTFLSGCALWV